MARPCTRSRNGEVINSFHKSRRGGLVTLPSPCSLSPDSNRQSLRRSKTSASRRRSISRGAEIDSIATPKPSLTHGAHKQPRLRCHSQGCTNCPSRPWSQGYASSNANSMTWLDSCRVYCNRRAVLRRPQDYKGFVRRRTLSFRSNHLHMDGVAVAKAIFIKHKFQNLGARYVHLSQRY